MFGARHLALSRTSRLAPVWTKNALRTLATESAVVAPEKKTGAGLWQRLTSFIVGAGLTGVFTQYYIFEEVKNGNLLMLAKQKELETRIAKLEKK
ncbi:predicted protein [Phaeodactylum tricornutum CCAP 1055/1]|jgi:hypothetical protein|uniref:Uncharacterized protein n=2 Tax=Phaeodactylum tricornutum TaxID=2850 RepID=B7GBJ1_PHATC|nr:predicted protein [Phaeodactylum tricornutum CCAP 1055/1]EEC43937.1 predicted protein [Phaeodactylum tricornutum CCAP 1055/1]|eukprot:XP_002184538.1 predicted protein [Phaeodactylum tricornutum CCAP 1055/1]